MQVNIEVMRPWVTKKVTAYLGLEDDIVINMVMAELEKEEALAKNLAEEKRKQAADEAAGVAAKAETAVPVW